MAAENGMDVIYQYHEGDLFPFGREYHVGTTFYQVTTDSVKYPHASDRVAAMKTLKCQNVMKPIRILKEETKYHLIYDYIPLSLEKRIMSARSFSQNTGIVQGIQCCISCLIRSQIKAQIYVENIGVDSNQVVKIFLPPRIEYNVSEDVLRDYYITEKTRILLEVEELWAKHPTLYHEQPQEPVKKPNFLITGNTLVFVAERKALHKNAESKEPHISQQSTQVSANPFDLTNIEPKSNYQDAIKRTVEHHNADSSSKNTHTVEIGGRNYDASHGHLHSKNTAKVQSGLTAHPLEYLTKKKQTTVNRDPSAREVALTSEALEGSLKNSHDSLPIPYPSNEEMSKSALKNEALIGNSHQFHPIFIKTERVDIDGEALRGQQHVSTSSTHSENKGKYKMKIITCEEIELDCVDESNLEQVAAEKLRHYQQTHSSGKGLGEPTIQAEIELVEDDQHLPNPHKDDIAFKIQQAKDKATSALKSYARFKGKLD